MIEACDGMREAAYKAPRRAMLAVGVRGVCEEKERETGNESWFVHGGVFLSEAFCQGHPEGARLGGVEMQVTDTTTSPPAG